MRVWEKKLSTFLSLCTVMAHLVVFAGPVKRSSRMVREVYPEIEADKLDESQAEVCIVGDVVYGAGDPVPADQSCLKCRCQPPGVQCETIRCTKKPGCKAIHQPNKCCPDYQCECEYKGQFYGNGERLETPPGGECKVCYCRGGELQCAEVSCYIRTDCEGRTVPGQCCPKYDHCPPIGPIIDHIHSAAENPSKPATTTEIALNVSITAEFHTPSLDTSREFTQDDDNKITESQTQPSQQILTSTPVASEPEDQLKLKEYPEDANQIHIHELQFADKSTQTELIVDEPPPKEKPSNNPKITIQEIIPEIKEIPMTGPPKREITKTAKEQFTDDASQEAKITSKVSEIVQVVTDRLIAVRTNQNESTQGNDLETGDANTDSSEISEVYHHPPPVLKIGDQLLFLKQGELIPGSGVSTPLPVITIIGAEGLQRGTEESAETNDHAQEQTLPTLEEDGMSKPLQDDPTTSQSSHILTLVKPKTDKETAAKSTLSTIEDFLLGLNQQHHNEDDDIFHEDLDSRSIITENVVSQIKMITNVESTTDLANIIEQIYVADVNTTEIVTTEGDESDTADANNATITTDTPGETTSDISTSTELTNWTEIKMIAKASNAEPTSVVNDEELEVTPTSTMQPASLGADNETTLEKIHSTDVTASTGISTTSERFEELGETSKSMGDVELNEDVVNIEQNPEYPPLPDVMSPQNVDAVLENDGTHMEHTSQAAVIAEITIPQPATTYEIESKILPDVLDIRSNTTIPENATSSNQQWLKSEESLINQNASLPDSLLEQVAPSDYDDTTEVPRNTQEYQTTQTDLESTVVLGTQTEQNDEGYSSKFQESFTEKLAHEEAIIDGSSGYQNKIQPVAEDPTTKSPPAEEEEERSKETMEDVDSEESREQTTQHNQQASEISSNENASIGEHQSTVPEGEIEELVEMIPELQESAEESENKSGEVKDSTPLAEEITKTVSGVMNPDAEFIDPDTLLVRDFDKKERTTLNNSDAVEVKTEKLLEITKAVGNDPDDVFQELDEEISTAPSHSRHKTYGDEESEAEAVFRELLEESSVSTTPPTDGAQTKEASVSPTDAREKETEILQRVSDAISKFQIKESRETLDASILGILRDFFSSQYKSYMNEE